MGEKLRTGTRSGSDGELPPSRPLGTGRSATEVELAAARATIAALRAQVRKAAFLEGHVRALESRIEALERSASFRLGHAIVRTAKLPAALLRGQGWSATARAPAAGRAVVRMAGPVEAVAAREDVAAAEVLLYADIDLNVIDGSSIWLSSMASLLARHRRVILLARRNLTTDVVIANIENRERVVLLEPRHFGLERAHLDLTEALEVVRRLDAACPGLRAVFLRGTDAASRLLADRQFHGRAYVYLTDFYEADPDGVRVPEDRAAQLAVIATHARRILVQTDRIAALIREVTGEDFASLALPPPVADDLPLRPRPSAARTGPVRIGYAGKIAPDWGIRELLDWTEALRAEGLEVELTIVGNKISGPKTAEARRAFQHEMLRRLGEVGAIRHEGLNRADALEKMRGMDFVWCWRPGAFERATLELSTKLVEGVASGCACICFPNETNRRLLGADYPCFAEGIDDIRRLLRAPPPEVPAAAVAACREGHSFATLAARTDAALAGPAPRAAPRVCFAGHDFKFLDPFVSRLRLEGWPVTRDTWQWGRPEDEAVSRARLAAADVVFCEWGLANAVWYSRNLPPGKRLLVRIHLQEINERARPLTEQIAADRVDRFVFVSGRVRDEALRLFGWPAEKAAVIPNFVLDDEYRPRPRDFAGPIRLGMVGIIPWRKRLDRAIDLVEALQAAGHAAELHVKGPGPEETHFMHAKGRREELALYEAQYDRLRQDPELHRAVVFHPEGNDVAAFYGLVDHILSPSDFESFHYALADGVLSGCHPLVWPWQEAEAIYHPDWIVGSTAEAADRILAFRALPPALRAEALARNRALVCGRYGSGRVFAALTDMLEGGPRP